MGIFLLIGALYDLKNDDCADALYAKVLHADVTRGLVVETVLLGEDATVLSAMRHLKRGAYTEFHVVNKEFAKKYQRNSKDFVDFIFLLCYHK